MYTSWREVVCVVSNSDIAKAASDPTHSKLYQFLHFRPSLISSEHLKLKSSNFVNRQAISSISLAMISNPRMAWSGHGTRFWVTVCKTVRRMLSDRCLSVLSVLSCLWRWCIVAKRLDESRCHLVWKKASVPATLCWMGTQLPPPKKMGHSPQFLAHVYCGQTAECIIKIPLGAEVGLSPGHIVLHGDPAPTREGAHEHPPFSPLFSGMVDHLSCCWALFLLPQPVSMLILFLIFILFFCQVLGCW